MKRNNLGYVNKNSQIGGKEFWDYSNNNNGEEYYMNGFPWPPRSYTCSFCRKEFKSAQALGGHMNVHRRDRARMRQSAPPNEAQIHQGHAPPFLNLNINPSSSIYNTSSLSSFPSLSPSQCLSSSSSTLKPVSCTLPLFVSSSSTCSLSSCVSASELKRTFVVVDGMLLNPLSTMASESTKVSKIGEDGCKILKKKGDILRMDLEIGLPRNYDLDLELRLGTYY